MDLAYRIVEYIVMCDNYRVCTAELFAIVIQNLMAVYVVLTTSAVLFGNSCGIIRAKIHFFDMSSSVIT